MKILAELTYEFGGKRWRARVHRGADAEGNPAFVLTIATGEGPGTVSGTFTTGKAVVKWIRQKAEARFKEYTPTVDTLHKLSDRAAATLVPDCYSALPDGLEGMGQGNAECPSCPYRSRCGVFIPLEIAPKQDELSAEEKREKLRKLVLAKWGNCSE
jgi:hypothetical protein